MNIVEHSAANEPDIFSDVGGEQSRTKIRKKEINGITFSRWPEPGLQMNAKIAPHLGSAC